MGFSDCLEYSFEFAMTCIKEANEVEEERMKRNAMATRVARFAKDNDFKKFIQPTKKAKETTMEDIRKLSGKK